MLPSDIRRLILEYHDEFGLIEKKARINFVIRQAYQNWLTDAGLYCRLFVVDEYVAKSDIYPLVDSNMFISNRTLWGFFLNYFWHLERRIHRLGKQQCSPSPFSLF